MSHRSLEQLRRKAPQLIVAAIVIVIAVYVLFEVLEDIFIEGAPTVSSWGYSGIFTLMLLESSSLPIPSEAVLPFAGYLVSMGQLNLWITVIVATIAGIAGSLVDYYIGLKGVQSLTQHRVLGRVLFSTNQLEIAARWFNRHGASMVFLGRLIPGFRTVVSFPAGAVRMSLAKFVAFTTAGCLLWNIVLIYVGWYLGSNWTEVAGVLRYLILAAVAAVVLVFVVYLIKRKRRKVQALKTNEK